MAISARNVLAIPYDIILTGHPLREFKKLRINAPLKPGKPADQPKPYKPIAVVGCPYKLLEPLLLTRINSTIMEYVPPEHI